jgi:dihydroxyacetone kinase-like predicted kinase
VAVVPTTAVPQAFAALLAYDGSDDLDAITQMMKDAARSVRTAEVTTAVKDSNGKAGAIKTGQVIGIVDHDIEVIGDDVSQVACDVVDVIREDGETLTVLAGEDLDDDGLDALVEKLSERYPDLEIEGHRGDQPVYPVLLAIE